MSATLRPPESSDGGTDHAYSGTQKSRDHGGILIAEGTNRHGQRQFKQIGDDVNLRISYDINSARNI
jgi:hypothetical protein